MKPGPKSKRRGRNRRINENLILTQGTSFTESVKFFR